MISGAVDRTLLYIIVLSGEYNNTRIIYTRRILKWNEIQICYYNSISLRLQKGDRCAQVKLFSLRFVVKLLVSMITTGYGRKVHIIIFYDGARGNVPCPRNNKFQKRTTLS